MKALYNLELQIQKKYLIKVILSVFVLVAVNMLNGEFQCVCLSPLLIASFSSFSSTELIEKEKVNITIFSFGIKKYQLLKMKYITSFIYLIIGSIASGILFLLLKSYWNISFSLSEVCISFSVALICIGIFLMISFLIGSKYRAAFNILMIIFFVIIVIQIQFNNIDLNNSKLLGMIFPIANVLYFVLYYITKQVYIRKDIQ